MACSSSRLKIEGMSFLSNVFGSGSVREDWQQLSCIDDLDLAEKESYTKPVVLFKHSVTCGISAAAKHRLENGYDLDSENVALYYLDLLSYRDISNEIAKRFGIIHQSPQLIILKKGQAIANSSHHAISLNTLKEQIQ